MPDDTSPTTATAHRGLTVAPAKSDHVTVMTVTRSERLADLLEIGSLLAIQVLRRERDLSSRLMAEEYEDKLAAFKRARWCIGTSCDFEAEAGSLLCSGHADIAEAESMDEAEALAADDDRELRRIAATGWL